MTDQLRSQTQASTTFDLGGATPPRPRGTFFARFRRADGIQAGSTLQVRDLDFLVKTIDQPQVQPRIEELNQYNKKRQVQTGYTIAPVSVTIYDTADGMALRMWNEYSRYYFGDFSQTEQSYASDIISSEMLGGDKGYGLTPKTGLADAADLNAQFFFVGVDIYHLFGGQYTKTTLVNPKIASFDPDNLDYENMQAAMIRMSLVYEAVLYENAGAPQPLAKDAFLSEVFADPRLEGDLLEVQGQGRSSSFPGGESVFGNNSLLSSLVNNPIAAPVVRAVTSNIRSGAGGVLTAFGSFNFGAIPKVIQQTAQNLRDTTSTAATISATNVASGLINSVGLNAAGMGQSIISGVIHGAHVTGGSAHDVAKVGPDGLALAPEALSLVNANRFSGSQIGNVLTDGLNGSF